MISVDSYLDRTYNRKSYNCFHFARDVWRDLTGVDIQDRLVVTSLDALKIRPSNLRGFKRHAIIVDPCLVILSRTGCESHMGVYLRDNLLHLRELGAIFQPLEIASYGFDNLRYYT